MQSGLDDFCKSFELPEAERTVMRGLPILARLDGRAFHTFTRGLQRPYDAGMAQLMIETARYLVQEMKPLVGYTQSDEITLVWYEPVFSPSETVFGGRYQKLTSILAGMASAKFVQLVPQYLPSKMDRTPHFDCRVWQVPSLNEALSVLIWRERDATKNSITMAAQSQYSDKELHGKRSAEKQEMLFQKGINWNDYPTFFKRGTYVQRVTEMRKLTDEERERIPEAHRPDPDIGVERSRVEELELEPIQSLPRTFALQLLFKV
jgi:tRNA(His) guanylyltransferase